MTEAASGCCNLASCSSRRVWGESPVQSLEAFQDNRDSVAKKRVNDPSMMICASLFHSVCRGVLLQVNIWAG